MVTALPHHLSTPNECLQLAMLTHQNGIQTSKLKEIHHLANGCLQVGCMVQGVTLHSELYLTMTIEVLWMDSMTVARRLHRSWSWLTWTLGGSLSTTVSAEQSNTLGRNSPSFTCSESEQEEQ